MKEKMNFEEFDAFANHTCSYLCERDSLKRIPQLVLENYRDYYINEEWDFDSDYDFIEKNKIFKDLEEFSKILKEEVMSEDEYNWYSEFLDRRPYYVYRLSLTDEYLSPVFHGQRDLYVIGDINAAIKKATKLAEECLFHLDHDVARGCGISIFHEGDHVGEVEISEETED